MNKIKAILNIGIFIALGILNWHGALDACTSFPF